MVNWVWYGEYRTPSDPCSMDSALKKGDSMNSAGIPTLQSSSLILNGRPYDMEANLYSQCYSESAGFDFAPIPGVDGPPYSFALFDIIDGPMGQVTMQAHSVRYLDGCT